MSHVDFKKWLYRPVDFKGQGGLYPQSKALNITIEYIDFLLFICFPFYIKLDMIVSHERFGQKCMNSWGPTCLGGAMHQLIGSLFGNMIIMNV